MKSMNINSLYKLFLTSLCVLVMLTMTGCGKDTKMSNENVHSLPSDSTETGYVDENNYEEEDNLDDAEAENEDLEEIEEAEEEEQNISGIIVARLQRGSDYVYQDTNTHKCSTFTVNLDAINPETGEITNVRTFSSEDTHSCSLPFNGIDDDTVESGAYFNSDWSKMGTTLTMSDGAMHVGWIDTDGDFTDVSEMLEKRGDFDGLTIHMKPRFWEDYFYFDDNTEGSGGLSKEMRVRIEDLENEETEIKAEEVKTKKQSLYERLDYYDDTRSYGKPSGFCDWISVSDCVGIEDNMIYRYKLKKDKDRKDIFDARYSKLIPLIPEISGRKNGNAVVAPDGKKVAFLSLLTRSTDESPELFVVSAKGGDPVKIDTEYDFYERDRNNDNHTVRLMDWR